MTLSAAELVGTWSLTEWVQVYDNGSEVFPLGADAIGWLTYSPEGLMSCVISAAGRDKFVTGGQWDAAPEEQARAYGSFFAYAGRYRVHGNQVVHEVKACLFPNWVGADQARTAHIEHDRLQLTARLDESNHQARTARLVWRRCEGTAGEEG